MVIVCSVKNYSAINMCEATTGWTGSTPAVVADFYKEGSNCLGFTMKSALYNDTYYAWTGSMTGKHIHLWFMTTAIKEMDYVYIGLYDGTNTSWFEVASATSYPGG